jgi:hypothetical protein
VGVAALEARVQGESITATVTTVGANLYQYTYSFNGFNLMASQELDIEFPLAQFSSLSAGVAPSGFTLAVLQPNNPVGSRGDYTVVSDGSDPTMTGIFSVDASLQSGVNTPPFFQSFLVYELSGNTIVGQIGSGQVNGPEPGSGFLVAAGAALVGIFSFLKSRVLASKTR